MSVTPLPIAPARNLPARQRAEHCIADVLELTEQGLRVRSGDWQGEGRCADGCLEQLAVGDRVACLVDETDQFVWVLSVLHRAEDRAPRLHSDGALTLSADQLRLESREFSVDAERSTLCSDEADLIGKQLGVTGQWLNIAGEVLGTVFERVTHFSKSHLRTTEGMDRVEANYLESSAREIHRTKSKQVLVNGEKLVKTRGKQIHFG